jgi:hypothetical protein
MHPPLQHTTHLADAVHAAAPPLLLVSPRPDGRHKLIRQRLELLPAGGGAQLRAERRAGDAGQGAGAAGRNVDFLVVGVRELMCLV